MTAAQITTILVALISGAGGYGLFKFITDLVKEANRAEETIPAQWKALLDEANDAIATERTHRQEDYAALTAQVKFMRREQSELLTAAKEEQQQLRSKIDELITQNNNQRQQLTEQGRRMTAQDQQIAALRTENSLLTSRIRELEADNKRLAEQLRRIVKKYQIDTGELNNERIE
jgi:hypothetical protein